jgi:hypothetical protein
VVRLIGIHTPIHTLCLEMNVDTATTNTDPPTHRWLVMKGRSSRPMWKLKTPTSSMSSMSTKRLARTYIRPE